MKSKKNGNQNLVKEPANTVTRTMRLPSELWAELQRIAEMNDRTVANMTIILLREAIRTLKANA